MQTCNMAQAPDFHFQFHEVLGHLTIIKTVLWELHESGKLDPDHQSMVQEAQQRAESMFEQIEKMKADVYLLTEPPPAPTSNS